MSVAVAKPLGSVTARSVTVREIAALNHEVVDHPMEDGPVVVPVLHEEFEILHVNRGVVGVKFDGDRSAVRTAVPGELKVNDVGGRAGTVGDVDHGQHQHTCHEDGHDAGRGWRAVVEQTGKGRFTDAFVLHFVEQVVVEAVGFFVPRILFDGFPEE